MNASLSLLAGEAALESNAWFGGQNAQPRLAGMSPSDHGVRAVVFGGTQAVTQSSNGGGGGAGLGGGAGAAKPAPANGAGGEPPGGIDGASKAMLARMEQKVLALEDENRKLRGQADEAKEYKQQVAELTAQNEKLQAQISKMG